MYNMMVSFVAFVLILIMLLFGVMFGTESGRHFYQVCAIQEQCGALK